VPIETIVQELAWLLLGAALIGMLARWVQIPYAVALVVAGLLIEESHVVTVPELDPGLVLFVFLPPLLFDAAFRLEARELKALFSPILLLGVPGVLVTAAVVAGIVTLGGHLPLTIGLLFGSIVAATDPVAVTAVFHHLHVPGRLSTIAEGESLVNDGMAITLYLSVLRVVETGMAEPLGVLELFGREVVGGVLIGSLAGFAFSRLTSAIDDHLVEMTLSTALAYGSYLMAQSVHASGPLACVAAGLIHGSYGRSIGMSQNTSELLDDLWEYLGFLANGFVFLLVGFSVNVGSLIANAWPVLIAIVGVLIARALVVVAPPLLISPANLVTSGAERLVLFWGGLRGALTVALALALPAELPARDAVIAMAFGVVLFTLVVQGLTLPLVIKRLGLANPA
jgi:monovalent cation:H+ antiporter, CPA1 family